ncbi:MAG: sugar transferase, partial [Rhodospirillaceae bacterium]
MTTLLHGAGPGLTTERKKRNAGHSRQKFGQAFGSAPAISRWSNRQAFAVFTPILDLALIYLSAFLAVSVQANYFDVAAPQTHLLVGMATLSGLFYLLSMNGFGLYKFAELSKPKRSIPLSIAVWTGCMVAMMALAYILDLGETLPRTLVLPWAGLTALGITGSHLISFTGIQWCARRGMFRQRIAVVGATPRVLDMISSFASAQGHDDYEVVGIYDDRKGRVPDHVAGIEVVGTVPDLLTHCRQNLLDTIVIAIPWVAESRNAQIVQSLRELPVDISLVPDLDMHLLPPRGILWLGGMPTVLVSRRPLTEQQMFVKWIEDKILALMALIAISPIMLITALLVKLTSAGPIFFVQERFGFNNRVIRVLKFRSMYIDKGDVTGRARTVKNDPRITPV